MTRNTLPDEGGENRWFNNLNAFEQQETRRQVDFKRRRWPGLPDGARSGRTYPHILPDGELGKSFYPPITEAVLDYCQSSKIAVHTAALNMRSSQVCCFNVAFPLRQDLQLAKIALADVLPDVKDVTAIEFEYTGPAEATEWLGEPASGQRGQNRTSIDLAVWWRSKAGRFLTLCEWKYTERAYGTCGGYASQGNQNKDHCRELDVTRNNRGASCYLTHGRNTRRYWEHFEKAGIRLAALSGLQGCPFMGPFYQLMRQFLLAAYLRRHDCGLDEVFVTSLSFRGNTSLGTMPTNQPGPAPTVEDAWNDCLDGVPPLRHTDVESIVASLRTGAPIVQQDWLDYLAERYGI